MNTTVDLTEKDWDIAHKIANDLVKTETDVNELTKAIAYLRAYFNRENAGEKFFDYLTTLAENGHKIGHGKDTPKYYNNIKNSCNQYLEPYKDNPSKMIQILGWSARLMVYYQVTPIGEGNNQPPKSTSSTHKPPQSQPPVTPTRPQVKYKIAQILNATVTKIQGKEITYQIEGVIHNKKEKNEKLANNLTTGKKVKVKVFEVDEDDQI